MLSNFCVPFWHSELFFIHSISPIPVRNRRRSETTICAGIIWPKFSFINADIRHIMPVSETKDFITHGNSSHHSVGICTCSVSTNSQRASQTEPDDTCTGNGK